MRKIALALALSSTLAAPAAIAQGGPTQSGVELYGIIDVGIENVDNGPGASATRVTSGISTGSRWGIRGNENLGGGYRALFTLESRFETDTGDIENFGPTFLCGASCPGVGLMPPATVLPGPVQAGVLGGLNAVNTALLDAVSRVNRPRALFDRQAFVGLVTPYGAILLGRQYTPNYEVVVKYSAFADAFAGSPGQVATVNLRANNAIQYRAELGGFTASLMYGFGGAESIAGGRNERTTDPTRGDDFYGANLQYTSPQFSIGVGYNRNNTVTYAAPNDVRKGLETYSIGASAPVGPVKLFAQHLRAKNDNPVFRPEDIQGMVISTGGNVGAITNIILGQYFNSFDVDTLRGVAGPTDMKMYHVGLQWTSGNNQVMASFAHSKDTARSAWATDDASVDLFGLGYFYSLSKRSQLYAAAAFANNKDQARKSVAAACCVAGWTTAPGEDSRVLQAGIRHSF